MGVEAAFFLKAAFFRPQHNAAQIVSGGLHRDLRYRRKESEAEGVFLFSPSFGLADVSLVVAVEIAWRFCPLLSCAFGDC